MARSSTEEAQSVAHLIADEAILEESLAKARARAAAVVEQAGAEAARLRAEAEAAAVEEVRALEAASEEAPAAAVRDETEAQLGELRRRAARNHDRAVALAVDLATGKVAP